MMTDEHFTPFLLVVLVPLAGFAWRLGLLRGSLRGWVLFFLAALVWLQWPADGMAAVFQNRWHLLVTGVTVAVLSLRATGTGVLSARGPFRVALGLLAVAAVAGHTNFLSFHGRGTWMHAHDVAHYYLGSKYFDEIGYGSLYVALLRAELEEYGHFLTPEARDLDGNYLVPVSELVERSEPVKARFEPERWADFRADMRAFRETMGARYGEVLRDHGYNPTPVWSLLGGLLANRVPAGSETGIFLLTWLDPLLLATTLLAIGLTFGLETSLLVLIFFATTFGAAFAWKGGAFLRELSLCSILLSATLVARRREALAGALLGLATMLRVYPVLLAAGPFFQALLGTRGETGRRPALGFLAGFTAACLVLLAATALRPEGVGHWTGFLTNISSHTRSVSSNVIGVTNWLTYLASFDPGTPEGLVDALAWRRTAYRIQIATLFLAVAALVALRSRQTSLLGALGLGAPLVFLGLNLSAYYYTFLALLVIVRRDRPADLALIFGVDLFMYAVDLFEQHAVMLYLYKSLLLAWLFLALHLEEIRAALAGRRQIDSARSGQVA